MTTTATSVQTSRFPPLPEIGRAETWYAKQIHEADQRSDACAHEAFKVGQYITLALDPALPWDGKLRYFKHALKRHCQPPPIPDEACWAFYQGLAHMIREYAGREALRLACTEDDMYAARKSMGASEEEIENDAEEFFAKIMPDHCPEWFLEEDYDQLRLIRDQWI